MLSLQGAFVFYIIKKNVLMEINDKISKEKLLEAGFAYLLNYGSCQVWTNEESRIYVNEGVIIMILPNYA